MITEREYAEWVVRESGPTDADDTVLLLAGSMCSAAFYDDVMADDAPGEASLRLVACTLPGFAGTTPSSDPSIEGYAALASELAADLGCTAVVGHSLGANVAIEMAASGGFGGPLLLLSPCFSREDESTFIRALDRSSTLLGPWPYAAALKALRPAMKGALPAHRLDALVADMKRTDPRFARKQTRSYLQHLDRHGSLVPRLCGSGSRVTMVYGEHDDVSLTEEERHGLEDCDRVRLETIPGAGHFTLTQEPGRVAELIRQLARAGS
jgi:pimeloyl-ACP methyl ester carboxylesterase